MVKATERANPSCSAIFLLIDDYAKDGGLEKVWLLCGFYHEPLRSLIVKEVQ